MWSPDRRRLLAALAALPVAGCGFRPALGPGGPTSGLFDRVAFAAPTDRNAFELVARLEDRLGRAGRGALYRLSYRIETEETGLAITPSAAITRYNVLGSVAFRVEDAAGAEVTAGRVRSFAAYSATGTPVSTAAARTDAYRRLMTIFADQIVTRLIATSAAWASP